MNRTSFVAISHTDRDILLHLAQSDGRYTVQRDTYKIAEVVGARPSTVRARLLRMEERGLVDRVDVNRKGRGRPAATWYATGCGYAAAELCTLLGIHDATPEESAPDE